MPSGYSYSQYSRLSPPHGCNSCHSSQFYSTHMLGAGLGPHLERFGLGPAYFQRLPIVSLVLQGKHWFLEAEPTGLDPNSISKWMSNLSQIINLRWHGIGLWSDCWWMGVQDKVPSTSQGYYPLVPFMLSPSHHLLVFILNPSHQSPVNYTALSRAFTWRLWS